MQAFECVLLIDVEKQEQKDPSEKEGTELKVTLVKQKVRKKIYQKVA